MTDDHLAAYRRRRRNASQRQYNTSDRGRALGRARARATRTLIQRRRAEWQALFEDAKREMGL